MKEIFIENILFGYCDPIQTSKPHKTYKNQKKISASCLNEYKESIKPSLGGSIAMD